MGLTFRAIARFLLVVDRANCFKDAQRHIIILSNLEQRAYVLRKTGSAEPGSCMQKLCPDPVIKSDAARYFLDVDANFLAQIGDFVDEGDFSRQERISGILDELGVARRSV